MAGSSAGAVEDDWTQIVWLAGSDSAYGE